MTAKLKYKIKIRFNTDCKDGIYCWRAIINGVENLVKNIHVNVPSKTTRDYMKEKDEFKWHISCEANDVEFKDGELFIK